MPAHLATIMPGHRYAIHLHEGAAVHADRDLASDTLHHLPFGAIVVCAETADSLSPSPTVRISSPAGWMAADALAFAGPAAELKLDYATFQQDHLKIATGDNYGLPFPFTLAQLNEQGAPFLTQAFRASGAIARDNVVTRMLMKPMSTMGASESAILTLSYEHDEPGLQTDLFVKMPPDKGLDFKYAITSMSQSEVEMQRLLARLDLSFATAKYYYGDYSSATSNYILITERIPYAVPPIEPPYKKGYDHLIPDVDEHYRVMTVALASLVAAHKRGGLGHDLERVFPFARSARRFDAIDDAETKVDRLIDFVGRIAPQLFVKEGTDPAFLARWREDILFGLAHKDAVIDFLHRNVDYTGLCHPNLNPDNAWFWRDGTGTLQVGLLDWGGAGQMSIAQALSGMLMMPIPESYLRLQRDVIATFIDAYAQQGGMMLNPDTLHFHYKASLFSTAIGTIVGLMIDVLFQFSDEEYASMRDRFDPRLIDGGLYAAIVWIDNMLRDWLDDLTPGDACRQILSGDTVSSR